MIYSYYQSISIIYTYKTVPLLTDWLTDWQATHRLNDGIFRNSTIKGVKWGVKVRMKMPFYAGELAGSSYYLIIEVF